MKQTGVLRGCAVTLLVAALLACDRQGSDNVTVPATGTATPSVEPGIAPAAPIELKDVVEATPEYVIGISYPRSAVRYPGLAAELKRYADAERSELMQAVQSRDAGADPMMYDLSLSFSEVANTPALAAYAADGSSFTGGAHGTPLLARFVWLPAERRLLTSTELIPQARGWEVISDYVREQLHAALSQRVDADALAPTERAEVVRGAGRMIDEGTEVDPGNFAHFEPVLDRQGKVAALRFVFPPYQVGPYSDGTQAVEVPASVLLPHVAPQYQGLFARG